MPFRNFKKDYVYGSYLCLLMYILNFYCAINREIFLKMNSYCINFINVKFFYLGPTFCHYKIGLSANFSG